VSDELVAYVSEASKAIIDGGRARGAFGAELEPAADATLLERLAAFAGRTPIKSAA
jgi:hypothetical protein